MNKWRDELVVAGQLGALLLFFSALYYNNIHEIPCKWTFVGLLSVHVTCMLVGSSWSGYVHSFHVAPGNCLETSVLYLANAADLREKTNDSVEVPGG